MDIHAIVEASAQEAGMDTSGDEPIEMTDDGSGESSDDTSEAAPEPETSEDAPVETPAEPAAPTEEDELKALEAELTAKNPSLNKGKIPVSRHQAVLDRARRKHEAEVKALNEKYSRFDDPRNAQRLAAAELAETNPREYVKRLLSHPNYSPVVEQILAERAPQAAPAAKAEPVVDEKPKPNYLYSDGTLGYDAEGQQKLLEWQERQLKADYAAELKRHREEVQKSIEPFVKAAEAEQALAATVDKIRPTLQSARRWPGFVEHEADIKALALSPEYYGLPVQEALERAYDAVVPAKLKLKEEQTKAQMRADLVKEMQAKSKARTAAAPGGVPASSGSSGPKSIASIVAETAAAMAEAE